MRGRRGGGGVIVKNTESHGSRLKPLLRKCASRSASAPFGISSRLTVRHPTQRLVRTLALIEHERSKPAAHDQPAAISPCPLCPPVSLVVSIAVGQLDGKVSVAARQPTGVSRERDELLDARRRQALLREKLLAAAQAGARVGAEERELDKREAALLPHRGLAT